MLAVVFAMVLAMVGFLAISTWAAAPKHAGSSTVPVLAKAVNYRAELWKVY